MSRWFFEDASSWKFEDSTLMLSWCQSFTVSIQVVVVLAFYLDDDEEYTIAITPDLPTKELEYSLSMGDENLSTIPKKELDELIKSSVENLIPIPSESEVTSDNKSECDGARLIDESLRLFQLSSNPTTLILTTIFTSSDDESLSDEDFDYLLEEFSGELAHIDPIPPRIEKADFDLEEEIRFIENLLYDNSSPRPPEERNSEIADTIIGSPSPSPIPVTDSDSLIEEIDLFLASDDLDSPVIPYDHEDPFLFPILQSSGL
ncbi:hypothetical protein Tco_0655435 [Tanacetum coccineum]|uniref:Reverse transcriptase domain-containing protein n=1 Tax=Tanacetum coccineum TaxID=301880 RepID=A0ABQ4X653_9ASTR